MLPCAYGKITTELQAFGTKLPSEVAVWNNSQWDEIFSELAILVLPNCIFSRLKKKYIHEIKNAPSEISSTHCVIYKQFYSESCQEIENADEYSYVYLSVPRGKRKFFLFLI